MRPTNGKRTRSRFAYAALIAIGLTVAAWFLVPRGANRRNLDEIWNADSEIAEVRQVNPGYVGMQQCRACHATRVAEFSKTRHALAYVTPTASNMPIGFEPGKGLFRTDDRSLHFEMSREGDRYFQTSVRKFGGEEIRTKTEIAFVYGGQGKLDEVNFAWEGDGLYELPIGWLHTKNCWGAASFDRTASGSFGRAMQPRCLECHFTWFEHKPGTENRYFRESMIPSVTCERCHGPGKEHVEFHRSDPRATVARHIIHPGTFKREQLTDLCAQCHSNAPAGRGQPMRYRPGEPIEKYFRTFLSTTPETDHVANQVRYMKESKCHIQDESFTCISCHNPHRVEEPSITGYRACLKCHEPEKCTDRKNLPEGVRDQCADCHMPSRYKIQVAFATETEYQLPPVRVAEHRVGIYPAARKEVFLHWFERNARSMEADKLRGELVEHWLNEADKFSKQHRTRAAISAAREAHRIGASAKTKAKVQEAVSFHQKIDDDLATGYRLFEAQRFGESISWLRGVLQRNPHHALAHGKLGTALAATGQNELAAKHWQRVNEHDPDNAYGITMLAWKAILDGRYDVAAGLYEKADAIEPFRPKHNFHWGLAHLKARQWDKAAQRYRHVLEIDPNHANARTGLAHALLQQGKPNEALPHAARGARLTEYKHADSLLTLADVVASMGKVEEAIEIATKARSIADSQPARQAIDERMATWKSQAN